MPPKTPNSFALLLFATFALAVVPAASGAAPAPAPVAGGAWADELHAWKKNRDERLRRPDGWLTLVGLAWLKPGDNPVGSDPASAVALPPTAPARVGTIHLDAAGRARFTAAPGAAVTTGGAPVRALALRSDHEGEPTTLAVGSVSFYLIQRADRLGVRIKDAQAAALAAFDGLGYYPEDPRWVREGRFEPAPTPTAIEVPNTLGFAEKIPAPGHVVFELDGRSHRLLALDDTGDGRLFLVFGDKTNGRETYGGGRFLYTDPPRDGRVLIDFNRAYNPPCVFSPYATCPLPPPGNRLPVAIEAGEKKYAHAVHP